MTAILECPVCRDRAEVPPPRDIAPGVVAIDEPRCAKPQCGHAVMAVVLTDAQAAEQLRRLRKRRMADPGLAATDH